jgi:hypothetical protein
MNEDKNTNTAAAAAEEAVDSIRKLLDAVGNDEALKKKLEEALAALTRNVAESQTAADDSKQPEPEKEMSSASEPETSEEDDEDEDDNEEFTSGSDLSDIFTEDALAGMVVGFVAGAAVVGGGVLIHKLISGK